MAATRHALFLCLRAVRKQGRGGAGRGQQQPQQPVLLEPAQLLRFLSIMRPELGPGEARYVMDHLMQVGGGSGWLGQREEGGREEGGGDSSP